MDSWKEKKQKKKSAGKNKKDTVKKTYIPASNFVIELPTKQRKV